MTTSRLNRGYYGHNIEPQYFSSPVTLAVGHSLTLNVTLAPATSGSVTGSLSNAASSPAAIVLMGTSLRRQTSMVPASVSFANLAMVSERPAFTPPSVYGAP